jgi:MHS family proline/betaine transporter-like MFS transporter
LAGVALIALHALFSEQEIYDFAWRYPFLLAILLLPFAFMQVQSEKSSKSSQKKEKRPSLIQSLIEHKKEVGCTIAITAFSAVGFYTLLTFFPYYFVQKGILTLEDATRCSIYANIAITVTIFACGFLSDIFRRKPFLIGGMIGVPLAMYITFMAGLESVTFFIVMNTVYGIFLGMYYSCRAAFFSEAFPRHIRCTGVSLSLSLAQAVVGGSSTIVMDYLMTISEKLSVLPITVMAILGMVAVSIMKDRTGEELL